MYEDFDFSALDSPDYKEDAVREDLIAPLLRRLGYKATGTVRMQRSKTLVHPFVMIGSRKNQVSIVPDYTLYVDDEPAAIIEAKGPREQIVSSHHVEQAYSYAIHPEVRVDVYALCNGRELVVYSVSEWEPVLRIEMAKIEESWQDVEEALNPKFLLNPELKGFMPDYGLAMLKIGVKPGTIQIIVLHHLQSIMRAEDDLYVVNTTTNAGDLECR
ncbi:type I restriction endonuclease [Pseudorhodoferax sp.]|uniref:type I restriction endonuclease n=1 Tax=Pseudorhodoferax sp. TaxID=1993553 RepID=UPI0039E6664A